jgi:hypothetical protein
MLFFTLQALAVGAMIQIGGANHRSGIVVDRASPFAVIAAIALILAELGFVATVLRTNIRVWHGLVFFGLVFLVIVPFCAICERLDGAEYVAGKLVVWHAVAGLILGGSGAVAGVWDLLERLRRPDGALPDDGNSSAMWPLD